VQYLKGETITGEYKFFSAHPQVTFHVMGDGFTWETQNKAQDIATAQKAWEQSAQMLQDESYDIVVFDELSYMFKYNYLPIEPTIKALLNRPKHQHVIITGRSMHRDLQAIADTISEVKDIEHAFRKGVKAQAGIEW
jgi:cob(I)alamin adenosyltransferase